MTTNAAFTAGLEAKLQQLRDDQVYKRLNYLDSPQAARVQMEGRGEVLILSSNNYLGLAAEPTSSTRASKGCTGTARARRACASSAARSRSIATLEEALARFVGTEASMSYVSAWNANEGFTATVVEEGDLRPARTR